MFALNLGNFYFISEASHRQFGAKTTETAKIRIHVNLIISGVTECRRWRSWPRPHRHRMHTTLTPFFSVIVRIWALQLRLRPTEITVRAQAKITRTHAHISFTSRSVYFIYLNFVLYSLRSNGDARRTNDTKRHEWRCERSHADRIELKRSENDSDEHIGMLDGEEGVFLFKKKSEY